MKLYNIVKVYTSTVGTGTVTLGSAVPSFITFATAGVITGSTVSYAIEDGNNREVGTGVYTSGAETLTRTVVTSTNSNNAITLSGNAVVFITGLAADLSSDTAATANTLVIRDGSGNFALGTPTSGTLTNCTGLPVSTGISGLGANVATFLATPSSANLASAVTDETGSGALVFGTSPTIATPTITTSATVPLVIGGTGTTSTLTLRSTSGVGTTGADIVFQTGNNGATEAMRIQNGGNVGIGVTPANKLHVGGIVQIDQVAGAADLYMGSSSTGLGGKITYDNNNVRLLLSVGGFERARLDSSTGNFSVGSTTLTNGRIYAQQSGGARAMAFSGDAGTTVCALTTASNVAYIGGFSGGGVATQLCLDVTSGNVGIGTASPAQRLEVLGATSLPATSGTTQNGLVRIASTATNAIDFGLSNASPFGAWIQTSNVLSLGATYPLLLNPNGGNVGIGTASPKQKLHVSGQGLFTSSAASYDPGDSAGPAIRIGYSSSDYGYVIANETGVASKRLLIGGSQIEYLISGLEKMRIDSSGNVGIGTSSPLTKLQVGMAAGGVGADGNTTLSAGTLMVYGVATSGAALTWNAYTNGGNANTVMAQFKPRQDTSANYNLDVFCGTWNNNNDPGTAVATFQSTGNVGIGTASPLTKLQVGAVAGLGGTDGNVTLSAGTNMFYQVATSGAALTWNANTNGGFSNTVMAQLKPRQDTSANYNLDVFCGTWNNNNSAGTAIATFQSTGNVGIGTASPAYQLQLSTDSAAKPTTNTWTIASDARLKAVKGEYQKGLAEICQVRPVSYEYNGKAGFIADGKDKVSILAQELMQVFPECVDTFKGKLEEDGPEIDLYNYNGHAITFALINAIKELKAKIDILEARN